MKLLRTLFAFKYTFLIIALLVITYSLITTNIIKQKSLYTLNEDKFLCSIKDYKIDGNKLTLNLKCKEKLVSTYFIKTKEEKEYIENNLSFNDKILINGKLSIPSNNNFFYLFNYKKYLLNNNIKYTLSINSFEIVKKNKNIFYKLKDIIYKRAKNISNSYIYAFLLGTSKEIDSDLLDTYRTNGIGHLLALSGLHVFVYAFMIKYITKLFKIKESVGSIITIIVLLFLYFVSFSISLLRAIIMFTILFIKDKFNLKIRTLDILYITMSIVLLINPFNIYQISFILSFTVTYFLIKYTANIKNYFISLLYVSTLAFLSSLIISVYYFGYINILSPIINVLLVPIVSFVIMPLSVITFIIPSILPLLTYLTNIFENINIFISKLNTIIYFPNINLLAVIVYYLLLFISLRKRKVFILLIIFLFILRIYPYLDSSYKIFFLDVGQGDSFLISYPYRKENILIDTGGKTKYYEEEWKKQSKTYKIVTDSTVPFLRKLGINKLTIILSHGDYDHMGEAINLVENFKVEKVIFNCGDLNELEKELIKVLEKKKIPYYSCIKELNMDNNKLYFLQTREYDNENDNSNVIYTEIDGYKFMFMGDAGVDKEKDILGKYNLSNIDVLKVGHHGSKTSSSKDFINEINPKNSIISVGKKNKYGHPNKEVLENLEKSKIYRTDQNGSIMFKIKNNKLKIETCTQ